MRTKNKEKPKTRGRERKPRATKREESSGSENEKDNETEELERVSLESLTISNDSEPRVTRKRRNPEPIPVPVRPAQVQEQPPPQSQPQKSKGGRPKSTSPSPRSPQRKRGRQHRPAKPFLGSKSISGSARKIFLETDHDSILYERSKFELEKPRRQRIAWTVKETSFLQKGVLKYGEGAWSSIISDPNLHFHPRRTQVDLKDKWRNLTSYVPYQEHPIREFVLVNSQHQEIVTPAGNLHVFKNRWPRDAALKVATKDQYYTVDEEGKMADSVMIYLKESMDGIGRSERPQLVHVYRGTRTLQRPNGNIPKFAGYAAVWTGKVEKVGEELLVKPLDILTPEEVEMKRRMKKKPTPSSSA